MNPTIEDVAIGPAMSGLFLAPGPFERDAYPYAEGMEQNKNLPPAGPLLLPLIDLKRMYPDAIGQNPVFVHCPSHGDTNKPNLAVNEDYTYCFRCKFTETAVAHVMRVKGVEAPQAWAYMRDNLLTDAPRKSQAPEDDTPPLYPSLADRYVRNLQDNPDKLAWFKARGLTEDTVRRARLGYFRGSWGAFTIPVFGLRGELLNVRFRADFDANPEIPFRYWGMKGHNAPQWYLPPLFWGKKGRQFPSLGDMISSLSKRPRVFLLEGEFDALVTCQAGLAAISITDGAQALSGRHDFNLGDLRGLEVFVAYDMDEAGWEGAKAVVGKLVEAGVWACALRWDANLGNDASEVAANGHDLKSVLEGAIPEF